MKETKLFLIHSMSRNGGTERVAANLGNNWINENDKVIIVVIEPGINSFYSLSENIDQISLEISRPNNLFMWIIWYCRVIYKLRQVLKSKKPKFLISFATVPSLCAIICKMGLPVKNLVFEHANYMRYKNSFVYYIRRYLYPYADAIIALTKRDQAHFAKFCHRSYTIPNVVTTLDYDNVQIDYSQKRIIAVGRNSRIKGFDLLLKAWNKSFKYFPEWKLDIICGGFSEIDAICFEELPEWNNVKHSINLLIPKNDILDYYKNASIYVMSSRFEGFPMVLLEAMACGLAVISFDCPNGPREIINNEINGILVPAEDVDELSASLCLLMSDIETRQRLGLAAKELREKYGWENIKQQWENVFSELK